MENIFENAYFGKRYKSRDGRKAIYIRESVIDQNAVLIAYENSVSLYRILKDGRYWATPDIESDNDIVSEWQEEINEKEVDKIAENNKVITIEERANKFTDFSLHNGIKGTIKHTYIYAATEQRKIDIDNACKEFINFLNTRVDNPNYQLRKEDFPFWIEDFRKALEK